MSHRIWPPGGPADRLQHEPPPPDAPLRDRVIHALRSVFDPEIPINIYDLGLIYELTLQEEQKRAVIRMTLTTPNCPEAESLPVMVKRSVEHLREIDECEVVLVWSPPWDKSKMSEDAKLLLGIE